MNRLCCFDFDGTLADTSADIVAAVNLLRSEYGLPPLGRAEILAATGDGAALLAQRCLPVCPDNPAERMARCYAACRSSVRLYPGVGSGLAQLRADGWKLLLVSNKPRESCDPLLERLKIAEYFDLVIGGGEGFPLKPSPAALEYAMTRLDAPDRGRNWLLGDHYTDLAMGTAAKVNRAFAAYGFGTPRNETWDFRAPDFPAFIERLLADA